MVGYKGEGCSTLLSGGGYSKGWGRGGAVLLRRGGEDLLGGGGPVGIMTF